MTKVLKRCRCGGAQIEVSSEHAGSVDCGEIDCAIDAEARRKKFGYAALGQAMGEAIRSELRRPSSFTLQEQLLLKL